MYFVKKLISFAITIAVVALLSFVLFSIIPSDAAVTKLGTNATAEAVEEAREAMGLNDPVVTRFFRWAGDAIKGDFGYSIRYENVRVGDLIASRLPVTLTLAGLSVLLTALIAIPIGLWSAQKPGGFLDRFTDAVSVAFMAVPSFVQGILVTLIFGIVLHAFTPGGYIEPRENLTGFLGFMFFPALSVALPKIAMTVRFMKTSVKTELNENYVRTARAKGNTTEQVMWKHVFGNSLIPVITFVGLIVAEVLAGSIMIEQVFNLPGMGRLLVTSILNRDFNVVQAIVIYIATTVLFVNMAVDLIVKALDPRT